MAQTLFLPPSIMPGSIPSSPDPTPLRLIAFSVAEAALQSDPNSPSLALHTSNHKTSLDTDWFGPWSVPVTEFKPKQTSLGPENGRAGGRLWDVVEKAKERRVRNSSPHSKVPPPTEPVSPAAYNFKLPANSPLAAAIAASPEKRSSPPRLSASARQTLGARLQLSALGKGNRPFPLYTRSAEPSPTKTTFSTLDQLRPPPVFAPRLDGSDVKESEESGRISPAERTRSLAAKAPSVSPSRHTARLPSLAQIQAKMARSGHRRGSSVDGIPTIPSVPAVPRSTMVYRSISNDSVEVLQTPTDEMPPSHPRIVFDSPERRPQTPPSPTGSAKESRLAPFLRERTSGRLAGSAKARPLSMPPLSDFNLDLLALGGKQAPSVTVTPPRSSYSRVRASATVPPPSPCRSISLNTPPNRSTSYIMYSSPASPTDSVRSTSSVASPTLSVPIITCTPAPERFLRDGVEHDSDEEGGDVVLFEGESVDGEETKDREERERRGKEMLQRLTQRRRSD